MEQGRLQQRGYSDGTRDWSHHENVIRSKERVGGLHPGLWTVWICRRRDELARGEDAVRPHPVPHRFGCDTKTVQGHSRGFEDDDPGDVLREEVSVGVPLDAVG